MCASKHPTTAITAADLTKALRDAFVDEVRHKLDKPEVQIRFTDRRRLIFHNVALFRSESCFHEGVEIQQELELFEAEMIEESWLIDEALNATRPDGHEKWDEEEAEMGVRKKSYIHVHLNCLEWNFDIVCESFQLAKPKDE